MSQELKILYVEDEESIREEMVEILELDFENIYIAKNGQEGLEMYEKYSPDLVISDVQMPFMDGISMSKEILSLNSDAKIILTTAFNEETFTQGAKEVGITEYVNKPIKIDKLFESINRCLKSNCKDEV